MTIAEVVAVIGGSVAAASAIITCNAFVVRLVVRTEVQTAVIKTKDEIQKAISDHAEHCPALNSILKQTLDKRG
ncbi:hypothetical protein PDESU_03297 [Pontiella desulfatans]|uniref:Uncharacterized protein n=1 Tax=Pontiella desulfatans TaxID=2750659 RepID=A0A6C2U3V4_PONDE|nr:hypothetical protein [Pontiella desulfatans]VGO14728.1 hypothetical protein PDESU_03297 [Pontiella desulfatans]